MEDQPPPPYECPPPSYDDVIKGYHHTPLASWSGLSVVDFWPESNKVRFPAIIEKANEWLGKNSNWEAKTCESIQVKSEVGIPNVDCVTFKSKTFVRGLRLWLTSRSSKKTSPQQIAYFNIIPKETGPGFTVPTFQDTKAMLAELNDKLRINPIEGRILTVETMQVKYSHSNRNVDPDKVQFTDNILPVLVLRVYYEYGPCANELTGIIDFFPHCLYPGSFCKKPKYELFPDVVEQASNWVQNQDKSIRLCHIQSLPMRVQQEQNNFLTLRVLRVHYLRPSSARPEEQARSNFVGPLMSKTFLPIQVTDGVSIYQWGEPPMFESMRQTLLRIAQWAQENNARIISAETCAIRMYSGSEGHEGPQTMVLVSGVRNYFIWVIRVYVDGVYPDPCLGMCPIAYRGWSATPVREESRIPSMPPRESFCSFL